MFIMFSLGSKKAEQQRPASHLKVDVCFVLQQNRHQLLVSSVTGPVQESAALQTPAERSAAANSMPQRNTNAQSLLLFFYLMYGEGAVVY